MLTLYADGLCEPRNPGGWACWGWCAVDGAVEVGSGHGCLGGGPGMTNNLAEYEAAIQALSWAAESGHERLILRMDSQLVVHQVTGRWRCKAAHLASKVQLVHRLLGKAKGRIEWVPRERNQRADELSMVAYRAISGVPLPSRSGPSQLGLFDSRSSISARLSETRRT